MPRRKTRVAYPVVPLGDERRLGDNHRTSPDTDAEGRGTTRGSHYVEILRLSQSVYEGGNDNMDSAQGAVDQVPAATRVQTMPWDLVASSQSNAIYPVGFLQPLYPMIAFPL